MANGWCDTPSCSSAVCSAPRVRRLLCMPCGTTTSWTETLFSSSSSLSSWSSMQSQSAIIMYFSSCTHSISVAVIGLHRELVVEGGAGKEELGSTLSSLPSQLSADDIDDFFSLAKYYASRTPQSFRKVCCLPPLGGVTILTVLHRTITACCSEVGGACRPWQRMLATPSVCPSVSTMC